MTVRVPRALAAFTLSVVAACSGSTGVTGTAPAPAAAAAPKPFEYADATGQYRYTSESKGSQSMMGQSREMSSTVMRLMTIAVARSAPDTVTVSITMDSLSMGNTMGMPTMGIDKVPGARFTAKLAPNGSFYSATGPSETDNPVAAAMIDEVARALPRLTAILRTGAAWTDSVKDNVKQTGLDVAREIVSKYTVAGDTTVGGESAWKILREVAAKGTGTGSVQGNAVTLESTSTGSGVLVVSKRGVLLGGHGTETSTGNVVLAANGMQIGLTSTTTSAFTKVK
jgi:hypothetical protein